MPLIPAGEWSPVGIEELEPNAWKALRHQGSACITAGPGAGKTEFLAQLACYLLSTGTCPRSRRILAISFKTDAAKNLRQRVEQRLPEHAHRFTSMTFDAFTKGLVDRFRATLPEHWRLKGDYEIDFAIGREPYVAAFLNLLTGDAGSLAAQLAGVPRRTFLPVTLGRHRLEADPSHPSTGEALAVGAWWEEHYLASDQQRVEFTMLNRLAELIVRSNPKIARAVRLTYPYVFVDEFQDTTFAQYDFLRSVFGQHAAVMAVGDNKQRIMGWAGALANAFDEFENDFSAGRFQLTVNHRSSPELVTIQHFIASAIDDQVASATSGAERLISDEAARIWQFASIAAEAQHVSDWIAADISASGRRPSDYALLTRQTPDRFFDDFAAGLDLHKIKLRNDAERVGELTLQDLLLDDLAQLVIGLIRLGSASRNAAAWTETCKAMSLVRGANPYDEDASRQVTDELSALIGRVRPWLATNPPTPDATATLVDGLIQRVGADAIKRAFAAYRDNDAFPIARNALQARLSDVADLSSSWTGACDLFEAADAVRLMTVHKSKGLEYHTVIFLGIDDGQWWAHRPGELDGLSTFFVGLSRAAQRAVFTYCSARGEREKVKQFYDLLRSAGVQETCP